MNRLANRIASVEQQARLIEKNRPPSPAEIRAGMERLVADYGTTLDEALAEHGGMPAVCYWLLVQAGKDTRLDAQWTDDLTPEERYKRLLNG